eukprot:1695659-Prymnesium_polylepis.1
MARCGSGVGRGRGTGRSEEGQQCKEERRSGLDLPPTGLGRYRTAPSFFFTRRSTDQHATHNSSG